MKIKTPDEFSKLCRGLHQDVGILVSTHEELARYLLDFLSENEKKIVKRFLDKLLSGRYSNAEIKGVWNKSSSDFAFNAKGAHAFTVLLRSLMD